MMAGNKTVGVIFIKDIADDDGDGFSNHDELVIYETDPKLNTRYPIKTLIWDVVANGNISADDTPHNLNVTATVTATPD